MLDSEIYTNIGILHFLLQWLVTIVLYSCCGRTILYPECLHDVMACCHVCHCMAFSTSHKGVMSPCFPIYSGVYMAAQDQSVAQSHPRQALYMYGLGK